MAKNENKDMFMNSSVIDIYDLKNGKYKKSFYIPNYRNKTLSDFRVVDTKLIALFGTIAVIYELSYDTEKDLSGLTKNKKI